MVNLDWMRGDWIGAAEWARRWIRLQPDAPSSWSALAWTYSYAQRPDSALQLLQRTMSLAGGEWWAIEQYARMLMDQFDVLYKDAARMPRIMGIAQARLRAEGLLQPPVK